MRKYSARGRFTISAELGILAFILLSMLEVPILLWRYVRLLVDKIEIEEIKELKNRYSYIFLVAYEQPAPGGFEIQQRQVPIINLDAGLENVWDRFKHNTRNEIKRAEEDDNLSFVALDPDIDRVYACYSRFERERRWIPALKSEIKNSLIFSAYYKNKLIAGVSCYTHGDIIRVGKIFSIRNYNNETGIKNSAIGQATRKIIWNICRYGKEHGYSRLDLGGVSFSDPAKIGITQFKQSFGGDIKTVYVCRYASKTFAWFKKMLARAGKDIT